MPEKDNKFVNSFNMNPDSVSPSRGAQMTYEANHMEDLESDNTMSDTIKERKSRNKKQR